MLTTSSEVLKHASMLMTS